MSNLVRFLVRDKNNNIFPENIYCKGNVVGFKIIGDIESDDISTNELTPKDNGFIIINGDLDLNGNDLLNAGNISPPDQPLSTTDSPTFAGLDLNGDLDMNDNDITNCREVSVYNIAKLDTESVIRILNPTIFNTKSIKITAGVFGQDTSITAPNCLHLQSNDDVCAYFQADRNNITETDNPFIVATQDGGIIGMMIGLTATNDLIFIQGQDGDGTTGSFEFWTQEMTDNGDAPPTFAAGARLLRIDNTNITASRDLDMDGNDILNIGNLFPPQIYSAENNVRVASYTGSTRQNYVTLTQLIPVTGVYEVTFQCVTSKTSGNGDIFLEFLEDGIHLITGEPLNFYGPNPSDVGAPVSFTFRRNLTQGVSYTWDLEYAHSAPGTMSISNGSILVSRVN